METFKNVTLANPFDPENEIWAICYPGNDKDEKNVLKLHKNLLLVIKNGHIRKFKTSEISDIKISKKRLLLPLILGGIVAPFSFVAIYENLFSPILLLTSFCIGIFLLYAGWTGTNVIIFQDQDGKEEYLHFRSLPGQVIKFIDFLKLLTSSKIKNTSMEFYHILSENPQENIPDLSKSGERDYVLLTARELEYHSSKTKPPQYVIRINPLKLTHPVRLKKFPDGSSFFTVKSINPESILSWK